MNSEIHINPMIYTHHIYFTQVESTYSTRVNAEIFQELVIVVKFESKSVKYITFEGIEGKVEFLLFDKRTLPSDGT